MKSANPQTPPPNLPTTTQPTADQEAPPRIVCSFADSPAGRWYYSDRRSGTKLFPHYADGFVVARPFQPKGDTGLHTAVVSTGNGVFEITEEGLRLLEDPKYGLVLCLDEAKGRCHFVDSESGQKAFQDTFPMGFDSVENFRPNPNKGCLTATIWLEGRRLVINRRGEVL